MVAACLCPVCQGSGVYKPDPLSEASSGPCHGCQGKGWVTVSDGVPIPPAPPMPVVPETVEDPWQPGPPYTKKRPQFPLPPGGAKWSDIRKWQAYSQYAPDEEFDKQYDYNEETGGVNITLRPKA